MNGRACGITGLASIGPCLYIFMGNVFLVRTDYGLVVRLANVMIVFFCHAARFENRGGLMSALGKYM